eukprot:1411015-Ditylum_brightwellii.AAC.1
MFIGDKVLGEFNVEHIIHIVYTQEHEINTMFKIRCATSCLKEFKQYKQTFLGIVDNPKISAMSTLSSVPTNIDIDISTIDSFHANLSR